MQKTQRENHRILRPKLNFYPPSQKAPGVNPWMNAKIVTLFSFSEVEYASAGFAEASEDATALKSWSFTAEDAKSAEATRYKNFRWGKTYQGKLSTFFTTSC
jgi:hypothetical protein